MPFTPLHKTTWHCLTEYCLRGMYWPEQGSGLTPQAAPFLGVGYIRGLHFRSLGGHGNCARLQRTQHVQRCCLLDFCYLWRHM